MSLNNDEFNGKNEKITAFFNSLKNAKPEIANKNEVISRLIGSSEEHSGGISLRAAALLFVISILFAAFSGYIAYGAISVSNLDAVGAVYVGVTPAIEKVSQTLNAGEQAAAVLISLAVFCFIFIAVIIIALGLCLLVFEKISHDRHGCKPNII
ncbi:MAG: hypothetical protein BWY32_02687 [bacterium ADurb.Bin243]|nr:MAG: hypothetical protein BWY32_02687 [bacterium ADurb.Bin243]HOD41568.1 hypothetical protein [Candidatus Wallbacteria bacterium]